MSIIFLIEEEKIMSRNGSQYAKAINMWLDVLLISC